MRDAYLRFFEALNVTPHAFFEFGLQEVLCIPLPAAMKEWEDLKRRMESGAPVAIRGYGRNGANTQHFLTLYSGLLHHDQIFADKTNNAEPAKLLARCSGYSKTARAGCERLSNYQVSHVFGRTKNPYAFTAPWNVVYIPKIIDPFTGHEAPGDLSRQFQRRFQNHVFDIYRPLVEDFNRIVSDDRIAGRLEKILERLSELLELPAGFASDVREAFAPIQLIDEQEPER